jgi:uncharacterized protein (TIGR03437 family)
MIRLVIAFLCAVSACMLVAGALSSAQAPATTTPDPFVAQITTSSTRSSFAGDLSANGRFLVIESNGDIATEKVPTFNSDGTTNANARNNEDGNTEIFLYDYAQRRTFQITNTKSVLNPPSSPSPTPSPSPSPSPSVSPSPTPFPSPTPVDPINVAIDISNNRPMISLEPTLVAGQRTYTIVFSSNAPVSPAFFDGTDPNAPGAGTLATDGNQEIWTYKFTVPDIPQSALSSGASVGPIDLSTGTFRRITDTPASASPVPGSTTSIPRVADDNREASISDDGNVIAFISNRNPVPGVGNLDADAAPPGGNPEVFTYNVGTGTMSQVTNTKSTSFNNPIFSSNPCLSSDGSVLAFVSNANLTGNDDDGGGLSNAEVYIRDGSGLRQVTKTKNDPTTGATANVFGFGRRLSRDGKFIAFESTATDPKANATPAASPSPFSVTFVYNVQADSFAQVGPRALAAPGDIFHFPTFTDYDGALSPKSVVFTSALNFLPDGTFPTAALDITGLNPNRAEQLFLAPLPAISTGPFTRLTQIPTFAGMRGIPSNTSSRIAFSASAELGGGNSDNSSEVFYQLIPSETESNGTLTMSTGASRVTVPVASPTATPSGSPTPSPSPTPTGSPTPFIALGVAPGELAFAQSSVSLAPSSVTVSNSDASESKRSPSLPIELNGVSVAINNAACGLYAVGSSEIKFVVPIGLAPSTYNIVINNNGTVVRGSIAVVSAQPDIFTTTNGPLGRASVCNITNPAVCSPEPFTVTTNDGTGTQVPTVLRASLTGVRNTAASSVIVTVGTTAITAGALRSLDLPGNDQVDFTLPSTVNTGDLPIVISVGTATSRPTDTAPHVTINAGGSPIVNPISTTDFFVRQQYLDFLNREPDAAGFAFWTNQISSCGVDQQCIQLKRINVSAAFFLSTEFQQTGYLVERMYKAAYGSGTGASTLGGAHTLSVPIVRLSEFLPDTIQIGNGVIVNQAGWQDKLEANKQSFAADFVSRSKFTAGFPANWSAQKFVDTLYTNAGLAPASGANRTAALNEVTPAPSDPAARARALRFVAEDPMVVQQEFNRAFVLMQYFGYLRRDPNTGNDSDYSGYDFWLTKLNQFNGNFVNAEMVKAFIVSAEYKQRFGQ